MINEEMFGHMLISGGKWNMRKGNFPFEGFRAKMFAKRVEMFTAIFLILSLTNKQTNTKNNQIKSDISYEHFKVIQDLDDLR